MRKLTEVKPTRGELLVHEFRGLKLEGERANQMAMRIDQVINLAVSQERSRCFQLVKTMTDASLATIMDTSLAMVPALIHSFKEGTP